MCRDYEMSGSPTFDRRTLLIGGSVAAAAVGAGVARKMMMPRSAVFIADHQRYDMHLMRTIQDGLIATGIDPSALRDKRVLLKPNLVEPSHAAPHMTTHPLMVRAAA